MFGDAISPSARPAASQQEDNLESREVRGNLKPSAAPMGPHTPLWLTAFIPANKSARRFAIQWEIAIWVSQYLELQVL